MHHDWQDVAEGSYSELASSVVDPLPKLSTARKRRLLAVLTLSFELDMYINTYINIHKYINTYINVHKYIHKCTLYIKNPEISNKCMYKMIHTCGPNGCYHIIIKYTTSGDTWWTHTCTCSIHIKSTFNGTCTVGVMEKLPLPL